MSVHMHVIGAYAPIPHLTLVVYGIMYNELWIKKT